MSYKFKQNLRKIIFRGMIGLGFLFIVLSFVDFTVGVTASRPKAVINPDYYQNVMAYDRVVALTFDDGPDPEKTLRILNILKKHQVPATFFFTGSNALKYPEIVQMVHQSGYEIGNHSFSHSQKVHSSKERLKYELDVTNKIIGNITGESTILYRPPFLLDIGSDPIPDKDRTVVMDWVLEAGYIPVGADIDSLDWSTNSRREITHNIFSTIQNGHIILLHDGSTGLATVEVLDGLITELKNRDYRFETVSDVIGLNSESRMVVNNDLTEKMTDENTNGDVTRLQTFLLKEGLYWEEPSGIFDEYTKENLIKWQEEMQISGEEGRIGSLTREAIYNNIKILDDSYVDWPTNFSKPAQQALEHSFQKFLIVFSAATRNQLPYISLVVISLVLFRLLLVSFLFARSEHLPDKIKGNRRGGASVIVPVYNEAENIVATLESILLNQRKRFEIIVVDDGSTDNSVEIIKTVQTRYPGKIKLIQQKNSGKAAALNNGISEAKYGVVVTVDGDTIFQRDTIKHLLKHFKDHRIAGVSGKVCTTKPKNLVDIFQHIEYVISQNIDKKAFGRINSIGVIPGPVGAWRKSVLDKLGGYSNDTLVEDQDLTLAVLAAGKKIVYEPRAVAYTETPFTIRDFIKQRKRWIFGTFQCLVKYRKHILNPRSKSLGLVVLPNSIFYTFLLPLLYPLMDVMFIGWIAFNFFDQHWILFLTFIFIDLIYSVFAFLNEPDKKLSILWLPLQRVFYRFVIYYVVLFSLIKAIEGSEMLWNKVIKRGDAKDYLFELNS